MSKIRVSELEGALLDYWVAKAQGEDNPRLATRSGYAPIEGEPIRCRVGACEGFLYSPSVNWAQAGPIIERERISTTALFDQPQLWYAEKSCTDHFGHGPTFLIASMRCYVSSKFGEEVEDED